MRKAMRVVMIVLVMGLLIALTGEAFARDRYSRGCRGGGRSFDRGPNYSDVLRSVALVGVVGAGVGIINTVLYGSGGRCGGGYVGGGGSLYDPYVQGYSRAAANIAWQNERRAQQAYNDQLRAVRSAGAAQAYRDAGQYR